MADIEIGEKAFITGRLSARQQFHVARRLAPLFAAMVGNGGKSDLAGIASSGDVDLSKVASSIANLSDADCDYVLDTCLSVVKYRDSGTVCNVALPGGQLRYDWIDMQMMLRLAGAVVQDNLAGFMPTAPSGSNDAAVA
ncbi:phage tail assembly chaperone [Asaia bogorensis]|uniref:phage tail assembly chaperone n=1 Tax=Asaia bogorensis TaxID=91915 RepID=UPI00285C1666|nr:hypothetical protein [Asaia bogorensis]MDR6182043.1 hypothetical protein [Asaia bogorensis NBRC 16594]